MRSSVMFETPGRAPRTVGTDCGRAGAAAALLSQPGGRCTGAVPPVCPPVPGMLSLQGIGNIPFEYVEGVRRDPSTNLVVVSRRLRPRTQRVLPSVQVALTQFVANMARFGMPIEAILTAGSYCCRCISHTNTLSNHSFGDAFDLVGVRWASSQGRETIVHNWNTSERTLLRRINACLRLSFATVIDYHRSDHRDHFHCDTNRGAPRNPRLPPTLPFVQEALGLALNRSLPISKKFDAATQQTLIEFGGGTQSTLRDTAQLRALLERLFTRIAAPAAGTAQPVTGPAHEVSVRPRRRIRGTAARIPAMQPPGSTIYERIPLGEEAPAQAKTGIYVPVGYQPRSQVDLIIYLHGMKEPSGLPRNATIDQYWSPPFPFLLREGLNQSGKNVILVAPTLGPASEAGRLTKPGGLDWYVDEIVKCLVQRGPYQQFGQPPQVGNIVIAGHSAGGKVLRALALRTNRYAANIREFWGFDCLYGWNDAAFWRQWAGAHRNAKLFVYFLGSTAGHSQDLQGKGNPRIAPPANVQVERSSASGHNLVPKTHLINLIQAAPFLRNKSERSNELSEVGFNETFEDGDFRLGSQPAGAVQGFIGSEHRDIADLASGRELTTILYGERGERLTFGEMVALAGDHFASYDEMRDLAGTRDGRSKIAWARWYALDLNKQKVPEPQADKDAVMEQYYSLASRNFSHFSAGGTGWRTYFGWHWKAINSAFQAGEQNSEKIWRIALTKEAFAIHFLTDIFSAGHVRMPRTAIHTWYQQKMPGDHVLRYMAKFLYDNLGAHDQLPLLARIFSGTAREKIKDGIIKLGGAAVRTFSVGDIIGLSLHDHDNTGLRVVSDVNADGKKIPGGFSWTAVGDAKLEKSAAGSTTKMMATAAVITSLRDLERVRGLGRQMAGRRLESWQQVEAIKKALGTPLVAAAAFVPKEDRTAGANVSLPGSTRGKSPLEWRWGQLGDITYRVVDMTVKNRIANDLRDRLGSVKDPAIRRALGAFVSHLRAEGIRAIEAAVGKKAR